MSEQNWFIHIQGETLGPLSAEVISKMLQQNRLQFVDFAWTEGFTKWVRISEVDDFAGLMPEYPKTHIPSRKQVEASREAIPEKRHSKVSEKNFDPPEEKHVERHVEKHVEKVVEKSHEKPHEKHHEKTHVPKEVVQPKKLTSIEKKHWPKIRRFARVPIEAQVEIIGHGVYHAINISEGGIYLDSSNNNLPLGTEVKFKLTSSVFSKTFDMTGIVIRYSTEAEKTGFVVEFTRVNPAHKRAVLEYVSSNMEE